MRAFLSSLKLGHSKSFDEGLADLLRKYPLWIDIWPRINGSRHVRLCGYVPKPWETKIGQVTKTTKQAFEGVKAFQSLRTRNLMRTRTSNK